MSWFEVSVVRVQEIGGESGEYMLIVISVFTNNEQEDVRIRRGVGVIER